jgi:cephalosporin hydroxylase
MKYNKELLISGHGDYHGIEKGLYQANPKLPHQKTFMELEDLKKINRRYMGGGMSQSYAAIYFMEYYFEAHRFNYVIEFGSQKGALSTYFANMAGITEAFYFDTHELYPDIAWNARIHEGCGHWYAKLAEISPYVNCYHQDIFSEEIFNHTKENMEDLNKTFIFCDGGDKVKEFNMYAPLLKKGDRIAVHDWGLEIHFPPIAETMKKYDIVPDEPYATSAMALETTIMPFRKL